MREIHVSLAHRNPLLCLTLIHFTHAIKYEAIIIIIITVIIVKIPSNHDWIKQEAQLMKIID